ncbi:MAG TPA: hypothetical protein VKQ29_10160 [Aliidongia sp.]|nr:hypothetical protein [Aliidongia sp.]
MQPTHNPLSESTPAQTFEIPDKHLPSDSSEAVQMTASEPDERIEIWMNEGGAEGGAAR